VIGADGRGRRLGSGGDSQLAARIPVVGFFIALVFAIFFGRLFQLQLVQTDDLRLRSERNYVRTVRLEAPRGEILDREGRVLATTRPAFGLQVIPNDLRRPEVAFGALGMLIDRDAVELRERVGTPRGRLRFQAVRLAGDLSYDQLARVESHLYALAGVVTDVRPPAGRGDRPGGHRDDAPVRAARSRGRTQSGGGRRGSRRRRARRDRARAGRYRHAHARSRPAGGRRAGVPPARAR
jgi:hypothetical protein